mmetsp:Transcript_21305/g.45538  ORF Transcript_21305/g.45538 Transcript_21305/m.45538 type:complete len:246 (-) Transcript_21305:31-768(-)
MVLLVAVKQMPPPRPLDLSAIPANGGHDVPHRGQRSLGRGRAEIAVDVVATRVAAVIAAVVRAFVVVIVVVVAVASSQLEGRGIGRRVPVVVIATGEIRGGSRATDRRDERGGVYGGDVAALRVGGLLMLRRRRWGGVGGGRPPRGQRRRCARVILFGADVFAAFFPGNESCRGITSSASMDGAGLFLHLYPRSSAAAAARRRFVVAPHAAARAAIAIRDNPRSAGKPSVTTACVRLLLLSLLLP